MSMTRPSGPAVGTDRDARRPDLLQPRAAVIIPHYADEIRLARCLAALAPQVGPEHAAEIEIVVVDNASPRPPDAVVAAYPGVRLVIEHQRGAAPARNRGVAETSAPLLFFLDSDCVPDPDWLETALALAGRGDVVGGRISVFDETPPPRSGAEAFETVFAFDNRSYIETQGFSVTANLLTRRDVFEAVGPFQAGMSEDLDWCRRATRKGFSLAYEDGLGVAHPTRRDWPALSHKWRRLTVEGWGLKGRGMGARARWAVRGLAMVPSIAVHGLRILLHPDLRDGAERRAAIATLARLRLTRCIWMLRQAVGIRI